MNITTEILQSLYQRAQEVFTAKTGKEAYYFQLLENGSLECSTYDDGRTPQFIEHITAQELTQDLSIFIGACKVKEKQKAAEYAIEFQKMSERAVRHKREYLAQQKKEWNRLHRPKKI